MSKQLLVNLVWRSDESFRKRVFQKIQNIGECSWVENDEETSGNQRGKRIKFRRHTVQNMREETRARLWSDGDVTGFEIWIQSQHPTAGLKPKDILEANYYIKTRQTNTCIPMSLFCKILVNKQEKQFTCGYKPWKCNMYEGNKNETTGKPHWWVRIYHRCVIYHHQK